MNWWERMKGMLNRGERKPGPAGLMENEIAKWGRMYRQGGAGSPGKLRLPGAIASELARLAVCELETEITGGGQAALLEKQYRKAADRLRVWAEYGFAGGGMVLKVCPNGEDYPVECIPADCFTPLEWGQDGEITAAEFSETAFYGGRHYRRTETHRMGDGIYEITNRVRDQSGQAVGLREIPRWAGLSSSAVLQGISRPLFVYFRTPMANSVDLDSPLGVSVYAGAAELIEQAEEQWERIEWEFRGGELAVDASEDLFEHRRDGSIILPQGQERLFRAHDIDIGQSNGKFLEVFSPQLRDKSLFNGLNNILRRIEFNCGLAYGTLSDPDNVERTAQEIKAGRQRSYATVCDLQGALEKALRELAEVLELWMKLEHRWTDEPYTLNISWGDSVVTDSDTLRGHHREDVAAGLMTREEYRTVWHKRKI